MKIFHNSIEILDILVDDNSLRYRSIMQDNSLTLNFSTIEPVTVPVGSYVEFEGQRYALYYPENFKKHNTRNFEYTLVLHGNQEAMKIYKFKDLSAKPYRLKFPLTAKPADFLQLLVDNININDSGWTKGDCIEADEKVISFNHEYCYDVLNRIASEFNTEWEVEGKTIHLRKVEKFKADPLPLSYGKGNGFKSGVGRQNDGDKQPIGRLYVQGGERNIDYSTYGSQTLLLPKSATLEVDGKTYRTDADGMYITRDGNNNPAEDSYDGSDIYPKRVGVVSEVIVVDEEKNFYDIIDNSIPESLDYSDCRIAGEKATIVFQSGALAGREFDIQQTDTSLTGYDHEQRKFQIVPAELDGFVMPGGVFVPQVGDKYAIFNISMPQAYISDDDTSTGASWDMFREAVRYFADNEDAKFVFHGELDGVWSRDKWLEIGGKIVPGGYVLFSDPQFQPEGIPIRITGIKDYINKPHKPEITLSNAPVSPSFSSDLGKLEAEEVVRESQNKELIRYNKRTWANAKQTIAMIEDAIEGFDPSISPATVQTMAMLVGSDNTQFNFRNNQTVTWSSQNKTLTASSGQLRLMMNIKDISPVHADANYGYINVNQYVSPPLTDPKKSYYLYISASKNFANVVFFLSEEAFKFDGGVAWYFLVGILNSEDESGERDFVRMHGFTEVLPGRINTEKIVSTDGKTYFDLVNGIISGKIRFLNSEGSYEDLDEFSDGKDGTDGVSINLTRSEVLVANGNYSNTSVNIEVRVGSQYIIGVFGADFDNNTNVFKIEIASRTGVTGGNITTGRSIGDITSITGADDSGYITLLIHVKTDKVLGTFTRTVNYRAVNDGETGQPGVPGQPGKDGEDGKDGHSPYIGLNGNWFVWDANQNKYVDSGDSAHGDDGHSPYIGANGNWWVWQDGVWTDSGIKAKGEDGKDGEDGKGYIQLFKRQDAKPTKPTTGDLSPVGWMGAIDYPDNLEVYGLRIMEGEWTIVGNEYKSKTITHNQQTRFRVGFFTAEDNVDVKINTRVSSQASRDYLYIGKLDEDLNANNTNSKTSISGTTSQMQTYNIAKAGFHFVTFNYVKDSSGSSGDDAAYISFLIPDKTVWMSGCPTKGAIADGPWSDPVIVVDYSSQHTAYLRSAIRQATDINGGLVLSSLMGVRNSAGEVRAYMNGDSSLNDVAFAAGVKNFGTVGESANVEIRHSGSAKMGVFTIDEGGMVSILSPSTLLPRLIFSESHLPSLTDLMDNNVTGNNITTGLGSVTIAYGQREVYHELSDVLSVTKEGATVKIDSFNVTGSFTFDTVHSGMGTQYFAEVELHRNGNFYSTLAEHTFHRGETYINIATSQKIIYNSPIAIYSIVIRITGMYGVPDSAFGQFYMNSSAKMSWEYKRTDVRYFQFGLDGMMAFFANNHMHFTESTGLDVRGATNLPGVLHAGSVSSTGILSNQWGAKKVTSGNEVTRPSVGTYRVFHSIGHINYSVQITPTQMSSAEIGARQPTYFEVLMRGRGQHELQYAGFDFMVVGRNY